MRWIWIDKFVEFVSGKSAVAIKNVSLAEDYLHDLYPAFPIMPNSLIIEGIAQTSGILVGESRNFSEKVILAKIGRAKFHQIVRPGSTLAYRVKIEQLSEAGASISAEARLGAEPAAPLVAEVELMFSHIDRNLAGMEFPEHNFVFTSQFTDLLKTYRIAANIPIA